jgi:CRP-like cAMP-binding protein
MEKAELMRQVRLLRDLDEADLHNLAAIVTEESFLMGQQVFAEGTLGDSLFIVKYGSVRVLKRGQQGNEEIARMSSGQHFGEIALIDDDPRSATVEAVEPTELIRIKRGDLEDLLAQDDALGHRVYRALAQYLSRRLRQTTADLTFMREVAKQKRI